MIQNNDYIAVDVSTCTICAEGIRTKTKMNENVLKYFAGIKKLNIYFLLPPFFTDASTKRKYFVSKQGATRRKERAIIGAVNLL